MAFRVLLVERSDRMAESMIRQLQEEGFDVIRASSAADGQRRLQEERWDASSLDVSPATDGLDLLRQYRLRYVVPTLLLTKRDEISECYRGLDFDIDDYLVRPFDFDDLLARLRVLIRRRKASNAAKLMYSDVTIDLATQKAERRGIMLDLTVKEQALLTCFVRHPNEVLSRDRIYETVWNEPNCRHSNTLEVHVMGLRRKLEKLGPRLIFTVRGLGYKFGAAT
jgi:two-component system, OmpR family, copper resistance phosphate regulon response regulator CusR